MHDINANPPFMLYVVWHPDFVSGENIGSLLHSHFGSDRYRHVSGGDSVRVAFRYANVPGSNEPLPINWDSSGTSAVVVLLDRALVRDQAWLRYVRNLAERAEQIGFSARVIAVAMEAGVLDIGFAAHALRWHDWDIPDDERKSCMLRELTYEFSRMLRHHLAELQHPEVDRDALGGYLEKVRVFLSHSKWDDRGEVVAQQMQQWLSTNTDLSSFLDIRNIPAGVSFESVIDYEVARSVMVAIYTDSYSSRPWCRHEVIGAKRRGVPMMVVDCLQDVDESCLPYMGNVLWVRMNPETIDRLDYIAGYLLDEVFKDYFWQCRVEGFRDALPQTTFSPRAPELISLASLSHVGSGTPSRIVYPGSPLSTQERQLFADVAPNVSVYSLTEWLAEMRT